MRYVMIAMAIVLAFYPVAASATPVAPEDLYKLTLLSNAAISPDGAHVLVEASRINGPKDTYDRTIALVDVASGAVTENVTKHIGDGDYAWMPDSRSFVFVRRSKSRNRSSTVSRWPTGAVVALTHIKDGVSSPVVFARRRPHRPQRDGDRSGACGADRFRQSRLHAERRAEEERHQRSSTSSSSRATGPGIPTAITSTFGPLMPTARTPNSSRRGNSPKASTRGRPTIETILFDSLRYESVDSGASDVYTMPSTVLRLRAVRALRWRKSLRRCPPTADFSLVTTDAGSTF